MANDLYITKETLMNAAVADEADNDVVWTLLAESVSRMFDRECEVADGFFAPAAATVTPLSYRTNGTRYLKLSPYIAGSITSLTVYAIEYFGSTNTAYAYQQKDGYIVFDYAPVADLAVIVTAKHGFSAVPKDIEQAALEMALHLWRKKDLAFTDISGVSAAAVNAEFSPTFMAVTKRYREIYSSRNYFA